MEANLICLRTSGARQFVRPTMRNGLYCRGHISKNVEMTIQYLNKLTPDSYYSLYELDTIHSLFLYSVYDNEDLITLSIGFGYINLISVLKISVVKLRR
jgi:hypothetical protein